MAWATTSRTSSSTCLAHRPGAGGVFWLVAAPSAPFDQWLPSVSTVWLVQPFMLPTTTGTSAYQVRAYLQLIGVRTLDGCMRFPCGA